MATSFFMNYKGKLLETVPSMNGWCDPAKSNHIFDSVVRQRATTCVELGVFAGRSFVAFALALAALGEDGVAYGVDTWAASPAVANNEGENAAWWRGIDYPAMYNECHQTCGKLGVLNYTKLLKMSTVDAYHEIKGPVDVLHIDGNHSQWDSTRDVAMWVDRVSPNGLVYFDDEDWASTKMAQELLMTKCTKIEELKTTNVCGVYRKNG